MTTASPSTLLTLTFRCDEYVTELQEDRQTPVWVATLENGATVWMDDHRPGVEPHSAWMRLGEYVRVTRIRITGLQLRFRSNTVTFPAECDGYFFSKSVVGILNQETTLSFYLVGHCKYGKLMVQRYKIPELILVDESERPILLNDPSLIMNLK